MRRLVRTSAFVRKEIVQVLRQPGLMLSLVLGPFVILLVFGGGLREDDPAVRTIFVVPEGSEVEQEVEEFARAQSERLTVEGVQADEDDALNRLRRGEVQMVLVFPDDAEQTVRSGSQAQVSVYHDQIDPLETQAIQLFTRTGVDPWTCSSGSMPRRPAWPRWISSCRTARPQTSSYRSHKAISPGSRSPSARRSRCWAASSRPRGRVTARR
jgi:hypothetical protein